MTDARRDALASVWLYAAEVLASARDEHAEQVVGWLRDVDPAYTSRLRAPHRPLARVLGFERAIRSVESLKRAIASVQSVTGRRR